MTEASFLLVCGALNTHTGGGQRSVILLNALRKIGNVEVILLLNRRYAPISNAELDEIRFKYSAKIREVIYTDFFEFRSVFKFGLAHKLHCMAQLVRKAFIHDQDLAVDEAVAKTLAQLNIGERYRAIFFRYLPAYAKSGGNRLSNAIVDLDDFNLAALDRRFATTRSMRDALRKRVEQWKVNKTIARDAKLLLPNEDEMRLLPGYRTFHLPNIPYNSSPAECNLYKDCSQSANVIVVTVGSLDYGPNIEAVSFYAMHVLPLLRHQVPLLEYWIVGGGASQALMSRISHIDGVRFLGRVEDLSKIYSQATFVVAPIFSGAGTNIKVIEAVFHRKALLCSTFANKGFHLEHAKSCLLARDRDEFVSCSLKLAADPALRTKLAFAAYDQTKNKYSFESFVATIERVVVDAQNNVSMLPRRDFVEHDTV